MFEYAVLFWGERSMDERGSITFYKPNGEWKMSKDKVYFAEAIKALNEFCKNGYEVVNQSGNVFWLLKRPIEEAAE